MKKYIIFLFLTVFTFTFANAQKHDGNHRHQWAKEMRKAKNEFIIKEVGISDEQKKEFTDLYESMQKELSKISHETRELSKKVEANPNATDLEFEKAAETMAEAKSKEGQIEKTYFEKFKKILTPKQLFKFKCSESKWTRHLMEMRKRKDK